MNESLIKSLIEKGEGVSVEFKECKTAINKNVYETICAFLNRSGGELLLGVKDDGSISGIDKKHLPQIKQDFVTSVNNPQKISPAFYLTIEDVVVDGMPILYVYVPESSQVHRCNGKIFDRNEDGDFNITDRHNLVASLYQRKQVNYSENTAHGIFLNTARLIVVAILSFLKRIFSGLSCRLPCKLPCKLNGQIK